MHSTTTNKLHSTFHPDVEQYFLLNGFQKPQQDPLPGGMLFIKGDTAVQFWKDKIEVRKDIAGMWQLHKSYKGFDGKDIFHLMMLMHIMDAINIKDFKKSVGENTVSEMFDLLKEAV